MDQPAEVRPDAETVARRERERRRAALESKAVPVVAPASEPEAPLDPESTQAMRVAGDTARRILREQMAAIAKKVQR